MLRRRWILCAALLAAGAWLGIAAVPAAAGGYYNLPGSFCQSFGYGCGAGYHACLVLGPSTPWSGRGPREVRLPCPPRPAYGDCGFDHCETTDGDPSFVEPSSLPYNGPQYSPSPAAMRPQILR